MIKLLMISAYFEPEIAANVHLMKNLVEDLSNNDISITVLCPKPSRGLNNKINKNIIDKLNDYYNSNVKILRFHLINEKKNLFLRFIRYFLFNIIVTFKSLFISHDVIFFQSTPPGVGYFLRFVKAIKKSKIIYNVQDFLPESIINTNVIKKKSLIWKIIVHIEKVTLNRSDTIVTISNKLKDNIEKIKISPEKIKVIKNWVDEKTIYPIRREENILLKKYDLDEKDFYIVYSGNIGMTQNLELMIDLARVFKDYKDMKFVIIGDGVMKERLKELAYTNNLSNMIFLPFQDYEYISHVYSLGDIGLVSSKAGVGNNSIPSKTWSIMACGSPIIAAFDSDSLIKEVIVESNCGFCVLPDDINSLVEKVQVIYESKELSQQLGENGRRFVLNHLSREKNTNQYVDVVNKYKK